MFEIVNSIDNAIINAHVLGKMQEKWRKWFLIWGILTAVVFIRGVLPFLITWLTAPNIRFLQAFQATLGNNALAKQAIDHNAYILLVGGGMFLLLLYFHWLFLEKKDPFFTPDKFVQPQHGIWFFAIAALLLVAVLWLDRERPLAMLGAAVGNAVFFILYGFRELAERAEHELEQNKNSDFSRLVFLEILDLSFSIDSVLGAFAFTTSVLLILIGNGIGALVVRELTLRGISRIGKYKWLKNGAMTSIGFLGVFMIVKSFGLHVPEWLPTLTTVLVVGYAFFASHRELKRNGSATA